MLKTWLIIQREYISRVSRKSFWISTFLVPLLMVAVLGFIMAIPYMGQTDYHMVVKDESGLYQEQLQESEFLRFEYSSLPLDTLKQQYKQQGYDGILYIPDLEHGSPSGIRYISDQQLGMQVNAYLESQLTDRLRQQRLEELKVQPDIIQNLQDTDVGIRQKLLGKRGQEKDTSTAISAGIGYFTGILLYMVLMIYGTMVMRGVIEEKKNRIVEILISTVRPVQLMWGKILGITAMGLTQFIIWAALFVLFGFLLMIGFVGGEGMAEIQQLSQQTGRTPSDLPSGQASQVIAALQDINLSLLVFYVLFYFTGGFLLYAALFAAVGSTASDEGDVQTLTFPVTIPVFVSFFLMIITISKPHSTIAVWSSMIPLSSPLVMPARISYGVPTFQIIMSMLLLVLGFVFFTWIAARIYRTGILMYGKKLSLREIGRWFFYR